MKKLLSIVFIFQLVGQGAYPQECTAILDFFPKENSDLAHNQKGIAIQPLFPGVDECPTFNCLRLIDANVKTHSEFRGMLYRDAIINNDMKLLKYLLKVYPLSTDQEIAILEILDYYFEPNETIEYLFHLYPQLKLLNLFQCHAVDDLFKSIFIEVLKNNFSETYNNVLPHVVKNYADYSSGIFVIDDAAKAKHFLWSWNEALVKIGFTYYKSFFSPDLLKEAFNFSFSSHNFHYSAFHDVLLKEFPEILAGESLKKFIHDVEQLREIYAHYQSYITGRELVKALEEAVSKNKEDSIYFLLSLIKKEDLKYTNNNRIFEKYYRNSTCEELKPVYKDKIQRGDAVTAFSIVDSSCAADINLINDLTEAMLLGLKESLESKKYSAVLNLLRTASIDLSYELLSMHSSDDRELKDNYVLLYSYLHKLAEHYLLNVHGATNEDRYLKAFRLLDNDYMLEVLRLHGFVPEILNEPVTVFRGFGVPLASNYIKNLCKYGHKAYVNYTNTALFSFTVKGETQWEFGGTYVSFDAQTSLWFAINIRDSSESELLMEITLPKGTPIICGSWSSESELIVNSIEGAMIKAIYRVAMLEDQSIKISEVIENPYYVKSASEKPNCFSAGEIVSVNGREMRERIHEAIHKYRELGCTPIPFTDPSREELLKSAVLVQSRYRSNRKYLTTECAIPRFAEKSCKI